MKVEKIRVYLLEVGDEFILFGVRQIVCRIENGHLFYRLPKASTLSLRNSIGANSRQRVELIIKEENNEP